MHVAPTTALEASACHKAVAAQLNNVGVALLEKSQHQLAASAFADAVRATKRAQLQLELPAEDYGTTIRDSYDTVADVKCRLSAIRETGPIAQGALLLDASTSNSLQESLDYQRKSCAQFLAVIMFNMGVVHHAV